MPSLRPSEIVAGSAPCARPLPPLALTRSRLLCALCFVLFASYFLPLASCFRFSLCAFCLLLLALRSLLFGSCFLVSGSYCLSLLLLVSCFLLLVASCFCVASMLLLFFGLCLCLAPCFLFLAARRLLLLAACSFSSQVLVFSVCLLVVSCCSLLPCFLLFVFSSFCFLLSVSCSLSLGFFVVYCLLLIARCLLRINASRLAGHHGYFAFALCCLCRVRFSGAPRLDRSNSTYCVCAFPGDPLSRLPRGWVQGAAARLRHNFRGAAPSSRGAFPASFPLDSPRSSIAGSVAVDRHRLCFSGAHPRLPPARAFASAGIVDGRVWPAMIANSSADPCCLVPSGTQHRGPARKRWDSG